MKALARLLSALVKLSNELLSLWEQHKNKRKEAKRDKEIKAVKENPTKWFSNHFGGVRDVSTKANDADKTDTKPD